jgi:pilus assembly protein Flp/PilA
MKEKLVGPFGRDDSEDGASAVEYGLLIAAIATVIVIVVFALGGVVQDLFRNTCDQIDDRSTTTTTCQS